MKLTNGYDLEQVTLCALVSPFVERTEQDHGSGALNPEPDRGL